MSSHEEIKLLKDNFKMFKGYSRFPAVNYKNEADKVRKSQINPYLSEDQVENLKCAVIEYNARQIDYDIFCDIVDQIYQEVEESIFQSTQEFKDNLNKAYENS